MKQVIIKYKGVVLQVKGHYTPPVPQTWDYPGDPAEFEITEIHALDNIAELLENQIEDIEQQVIEEL